MSREIESNFTVEWGNEKTECSQCTSFRIEEGRGLCLEDKTEVPSDAHCDFFQSWD